MLVAAMSFGSAWAPAEDSVASTSTSPRLPLNNRDADEPDFGFTDPEPLQRLATEWEPHRAMVVGLSFSELFADQRYARYQIELMAVAHHYVEIYVFCDDDQTRAYAYFLSMLNEHPEADAILAKTHFVDSRNVIRWTRDYGPIFGLKADQKMAVIDFVYKPATREEDTQTSVAAENSRRFRISESDALPGDVAVYLENRFDTPVQVVRPPLWMDGGDFMHDGRGNVLVSGKTVVRNGGDKAELEKLFQHYFAAKRLHLLRALPGSTVNHLDMIMKFVDERTIIVPVYQDPSTPPLNRYRSELVRNVKAVLAENEAYVRKHFPDARVLRMPMPPIAFSTRLEILNAARSEFLGVIAVGRGLITHAELMQLNGPAVAQLEERTLAVIREEIGQADMKTESGFDAVMARYGQQPFSRYLEVYSESTTGYRSYLNSLFLHAPDGRTAFVVPRFTARSAAEIPRITEWEQEVERVYREAWPDSTVHWINCDAMIQDMGFIHCTTQTLPNWPL
ncbi:agmatine deiminase family protein [Actomonas aquatica]|uniref:Agmatine deiminase family protein n=1 Tax=Actomonas aquatica TaxID=2866162 RepID=A0ABZ1CAB5_9BACT|nr:agmatine deiminase family protein [Opitutus sp. WL0086]WRQ88337.1 agmatine deiminase family protein [Opitutus sp. WL0086]